MKSDFNRRFKKFSDALSRINTEKIYLQSVKETSELALDLNRVQMYELGIDSDNRPLGQYTEGTKARKKKKGQRYDHVTLRDTGDLQDKLFLDVSQVPVKIDSTDSKTTIIEKRWPKAIGLTPEFKDQYADKVMEVFKKKINDTIENLKEKILQ